MASIRRSTTRARGLSRARAQTGAACVSGRPRIRGSARSASPPRVYKALTQTSQQKLARAALTSIGALPFTPLGDLAQTTALDVVDESARGERAWKER